MDKMLSALRGLDATDRELLAYVLVSESDRLVDFDMGTDPKARIEAYRAIGRFVRELVPELAR